MAPSLIIFDLGRVLIRICDGWEEACRIAGMPLPAEAGDRTAAAAMTAISHRHEKGQIDNEAFFSATGKLTGLSPAQVEAVSRAWLKGPFPGVEDLIARLRSRGRRLACLSNTNAVHWEMMHRDPAQRLPLGLLDLRFASHELGLMKPDPVIYAHVEAAAGVRAGEILFFDDHAPNIAAAKARGWTAVRIDTAGDPVTQMSASLGGHGLL